MGIRKTFLKTVDFSQYLLNNITIVLKIECIFIMLKVVQKITKEPIMR